LLILGIAHDAQTINTLATFLFSFQRTPEIRHFETLNCKAVLRLCRESHLCRAVEKVLKEEGELAQVEK